MSFSWLRLSPNLLVEILLSEGLICIPQMVKQFQGLLGNFCKDLVGPFVYIFMSMLKRYHPLNVG